MSFILIPGIPDAPSNGNLYARENGAWLQVPAGGVAADPFIVTAANTYVNGGGPQNVGPYAAVERASANVVVSPGVPGTHGQITVQPGVYKFEAVTILAIASPANTIANLALTVTAADAFATPSILVPGGLDFTASTTATQQWESIGGVGNISLPTKFSGMLVDLLHPFTVDFQFQLSGAGNGAASYFDLVVFRLA